MNNQQLKNSLLRYLEYAEGYDKTRDCFEVLFLDYDRLTKGVSKREVFRDEYYKDEKAKPVIFISEVNLLNENITDSKIDGRKLFFDSSIWCYYLQLNISDLSSSLKSFSQIYEIVKSRSELFPLNICKEYFEFNSRLYENSKLGPFGPGGHSTDVTPFKFHSETLMKCKAEKYITKREEHSTIHKQLCEDHSSNQNDIPYLEDYKWRLLLVDDYAEVWDKVTKKGRLKIDNKNDGPSKKEILEKILGINDKNRKDFWIQIETCKSVSEFVKKYTQEDKIYDIILFDYLLDFKSYKDEIGGREYSIDILKWIKGKLEFVEGTDPRKGSIFEVVNKQNSEKSEKIKYKENLKGPLGKFWFLPISAFPYAFMEDIRQMGYIYYDDDWVIARGADPVNTPELFRYSLFKFMKAQLDRIFINIPLKDSTNLYKKDSNILQHFIEANFSEIDYENVENKAKEIYPAFLDILSSYRSLKQNSKKKSAFAIKFLNNYKDLSYLISHFQHLLYMLAYLPAYNWSQMWDEFVIIRQYFLDKNIKLKGLDNIECYIVRLQKELS